MRTTTYKCDKCGAEDTTNKIGLVDVGVFTGGYRRFGSGSGNYEYCKEWCYQCRLKTGLEQPKKPADAPAEVTRPTLEDMVREIVREEIQQ